MHFEGCLNMGRLLDGSAGGLVNVMNASWSMFESALYSSLGECRSPR